MNVSSALKQAQALLARASTEAAGPAQQPSIEVLKKLNDLKPMLGAAELRIVDEEMFAISARNPNRLVMNLDGRAPDAAAVAATAKAAEGFQLGNNLPVRIETGFAEHLKGYAPQPRDATLHSTGQANFRAYEYALRLASSAGSAEEKAAISATVLKEYLAVRDDLPSTVKHAIANNLQEVFGFTLREINPPTDFLGRTIRSS